MHRIDEGRIMRCRKVVTPSGDQFRGRYLVKRLIDPAPFAADQVDRLVADHDLQPGLKAAALRVMTEPRKPNDELLPDFLCAVADVGLTEAKPTNGITDDW